MKRSIVIFCILLCSLSAFTQTDNCYEERVAEGDSLFMVKMYEDALDYYSAARFCVNKPSDLSELNEKIRKTRKKINESRIKTFSLNKNEVYVRSIGGKDSIDITIENIKSWDFEESDCPAWLSIIKKKNSFIYVCQPNNHPKERSCTIRFKAGNITKSFSVHQYAAQEYLTLSHSSILSSSQGGEQTVSVNTNAINGVETSTDLSWVRVTSSKNSITIRIDENTKYEQRYGNIFVQTNSCVEKIRVTQDAKPSDFLLDIVALRIVSDFELSMSFRLKNGDHIQLDAGFWDILRSNNLSGGFSASYIWTYDFADIWSLNYGIGLGFGGVRRPYATPEGRFVIAAVPSIGIECAPDGWEIAGKQVGLTIDYRPYIGTDCVGFYHNLTNFNIGVRLHIH